MLDEMRSEKGSSNLLTSFDNLFSLKDTSDFRGEVIELLLPLSSSISSDNSFSFRGQILRFYDELLDRSYLSTIVEETEDIVTMFDLDLKLMTANRSFVNAVWKHDITDIVGKTHEEIYSPHLDMETIRQYSLDEAFAQTLAKGDFIERERNIVYPDGIEKFYLSRKFPMFNPKGQVIATATIARDISSLKLIQRELKESENKYRYLFQNATDKIFLLKIRDDGLPGRFVEVNDAACRSLGYSRKELLSMVLQDIDGIPDSANMAKIMRILRKKGRMTFEAVHVRKDGSSINVEISAHVFHLKGQPLMLCISRDISERKEQEVKFQKYQRQLQGMSYRMTYLEEKAKRSLARQLHDNIGQDLLLSKLRLEMARKGLSDSETCSHLDEACRNLENAISHVRNITFELSPPVLYELGFSPAVEWLVEKLERQSDIKISCQFKNIPSEMSDDIKSFLFRAVRELLTNVIKHADATVADVSASVIKGDLRVSVTDNGKGMLGLSDHESSDKNSSFGLFSIREQARTLGGFLSIGRNRNGGSRVSISLPLASETREQ